MDMHTMQLQICAMLAMAMLLAVSVTCHSIRIGEGNVVSQQDRDKVWGVSAEDAVQQLTWSVTYGVASPLGVPKRVSSHPRRS